ncbi:MULTISPECIES: hypothetical protein [unclassified Streptomyces]|nr:MULTISPECIES: hypothetical protein [unclassified Streptomyces]
MTVVDAHHHARDLHARARSSGMVTAADQARWIFEETAVRVYGL